MTITPTQLTRAAGLSAVVAGLLFIAVQIKHPHLDVAFVTATEWKIHHSMKVAMAVLSIAGITRMYLRQVRRTGVLSLLGYLLPTWLNLVCKRTITAGLPFSSVDMARQPVCRWRDDQRQTFANRDPHRHEQLGEVVAGFLTGLSTSGSGPARQHGQ